MNDNPKQMAISSPSTSVVVVRVNSRGFDPTTPQRRSQPI